MKKHGNSNENDADHHLYEIWDTEDEDVYKYGICGKPLLPDGSSSRANEQMDVFNRVVKEVARFIANILLVGIPGRKRARRLSKSILTSTSGSLGKDQEETHERPQPTEFQPFIVHPYIVTD